MAKVKIQGNASGTGILTVTAPNTSTDRTITLPDEDVTLGAATPSIDDNGNSTAITIDSSEQVGVGTTSPSVKTEIQHSGTGGFPATSGTAQTYGILRLNSGGGWTSALDIGNNGGNGAWIQSTDTSNLATNYALYINKNGGQVRVGSGGITFNGDTAAANALDDYEEGTWTPAASGGASSVSGTYTKIGRLVHCEGSLTFPSQTNSGHATVEGLPFTINGSESGSRPTGAIRYTSYSAQDLFIHGNPSATTFNLYKKNTGGVGQASWTDMSGKRFDFNFIFQV
jgi:hypothetical protein